MGYPHDIKGQDIYAFIKVSDTCGDNLLNEVNDMVVKQIGYCKTWKSLNCKRPPKDPFGKNHEKDFKKTSGK